MGQWLYKFDDSEKKLLLAGLQILRAKVWDGTDSTIRGLLGNIPGQIRDLENKIDAESNEKQTS